MATGMAQGDTSAWLARVEAKLLAITEAESPFVTEVSHHILAAGGKRLRPLLVDLTSKIGDGSVDQDDLDRAALVVELTHVASLYHDDVMDEAVIRRGVESANLHYGNSVAILTGDYLFARASALVATLGTDFVALQAETFARMVQGQISEFRGPASGDDEMDHYLKVLSDKTAALISTSAVFGGMVANLDRPVLAALGRFGEAMGMAFQLHDDLLDITSDASGKSPGTDLRQGVATLPVLLLKRSDDPSDKRLLASLSAGMTDNEVAGAVAALRANPVLEQARQVVAGYARQAETELEILPECPAKDALVALTAEMTA